MLALFLPALALLGWYVVNQINTAPAKNIWPRWQVHQANSTATINHQVYQNFLTHYLYRGPQGNNLVYYAKVSKLVSGEFYMPKLLSNKVCTLVSWLQKLWW